MSHHLHNPFDSRNQSSTQGQYGFSSTQAERDPGMASSYLGPGTSFSSSGASTAIPDNTGGIFSSPMSQSMNYGSEQSRALMDENIEKSIEMHISRAREESRFGKPMHQPIDEGTHCTGLQKDEFRSSDTRMASHPMSSASASLGHRQSDVGSGRSSLDWLSNYKKTTTDDSKLYSSSEHDMQSIPGLGDYDCPVPDKPAASTESSQPKYTSESAANILQRFGLEKEDLEHLISYPDDQMTPENLPFILRQIRIQKAKRATTAGQSYPDPQPTRSVGQVDSHSLSTSWGSGMRQEEISSAVLQPSKVIDYGHTGKYTGGVGDEIGTTRCSRANSGGGGGMLLMDTCDSKKSRGPLQKHPTEVKSSALGSSRQQAGSVPSTNFSYTSILKSVAPPSHDQTKRLPTEPNQTSQTILSLFSVPKKDTDIRVVKTEASKPVPLKEPTSDHQSTSKTQPPTNLLRGVHPGRPGLVLIGSNNKSGTKDQSKTRIQGSTVAQQTKKQQKLPVEQQSKQQKEQKQKGQVMWPPFPVAKSVPSAAVIPSIIDASKAMQHPMFIPGDPRPIVIPPVLPQQISAQMSFNHTTLPTSHWQPPAKVAVFKGLPTLAMMQDYAAASPRIFPHTCSLCSKECTQMKDWVSHQNTSHHLESCTLLRKQYPDWDGEIALGPRAVGKDAKPSTSTSAPTPQHRHKKTRHGSRSRSRSSSPRYHHGSERRREKRSSRSRSPHTSRYTRRSRSRSRSPWYDRPTSFHYRSRSRSSERRSSPRRRDERRSSPRGSHERQLSPWRYDGRLSPPRRIDSRRSPPRRNRESQSSAEGRLAQKLLETSAVQSLSTQSDLEAVVKTLAPALLAELAKMKSSSSSSSSSAKKKWTTKPSKGKPGLQSSETGKSSPPTMVRLEGINSSLSHNDVVTAVEHFGKTKSVVLFRTKLQAIVCFEKEEDAKKMKSVKSFDVKGLTINIVREEETVSNVQKKPPQKKPAMSITTTFTSRTVLLPTPNVPSLPCPPKPSPSGAQTATTGKLTNQNIAATTGVETAEPMEVGSGAHDKGERPSTTAAVPENSEDKPCGIRPTTSETLSTEMKQNDPGTAVNTQMDAASADLTIGEMLEEHLFLHMIPSFDRKFFFSPNFFRLDKKQLLLSGLPGYYAGCYTEDNVAKLLIPFGLRYNYNNNNNIFVIPQTGMAFVRMPSAATVRNVLNAFKTDPLTLKWSTLCCRVLSTIDMSPSGFYKRLMEMLKSPVIDDGLRTFFINNVSPRHTRDLRKAMKTTFSVRNYLPLLNKMFIEFETVQDADRFQVWYSLSKQGPGHKVQRLKMPNSSCTSLNAAAAAAKDESVTTEPKGAAESEQQLATSTSPSTAVTSLTIGEMLEKHLDLSKIVRLKSRNYLSPKYSKHGLKQLMITRLPKYYDGCYTEEDIVKLLVPFGFEYTDNSIYVLPQMCMALFQMPTAAHVRAIMSGCTGKRTSLKGSKLFFDVVAGGIAMTPLGFYKSVMKLVRFSVHDNGARTVLISNVSPSEARDLKETFKTFGHIRNYLPLINKLFVEFEDAADANRIVAWFGLLKQDPGFKVHGLQKTSKHRSYTTQDPVTAVKTQWDAESTKDSSTGAEMIKQQPATSTPSSTAVPLLTPEEMVEKHMYQDRRVSFNRENCTPPKVDFTDDSVSSSLPIACLFDERNSIMNDSVTDDKFNDDVKDSIPEPHGSSSSSRARLEGQSSGVPPASEQLSPSVGEPSSFSSPLSTETSNSPGQKMQQSGTKSPAKASNSTSSGCSTRSSSAECEKVKSTTPPPVEASIQTHLGSLGEEATEGAVAKSDHTVSAEGSAAKTDESETKVETSSEMHPPSQGHGDELSQTQSLEIDVNVNTPKDQRKSREEGNEDDVDKHTEEEEDDDVENYLILDSLDDQTDKQMDDVDRGCSSETHPAVPEEDQTLHEESCQVLDSVNGQGRARPEDDSEMEMDSSFQVLDSVTEDQAATGQEDGHLVQDDGSTVKGLSEEAAGPVDNKSHEKSAIKDAVEDSNDMENPVEDEQCSDIKDNLKDPDNEDTEQETFEILDSIDDQTATEDDSQQLETGSDQIPKEDISPIDQEEDTFQVIDSLEDQPTTTENEPETDNKEKRTRKGEATARKDGPPRRSGRTATASKTEEKEKSPKKQDRAVKKYETRTKMDTTAGVSKKDKEIKEATEEMMYEIVDSVEDDPVQDAATSERTGPRRSARGKKTEVSERPDSVEEENTNGEPTVTTRSTRGRERTSKKDASNAKTNKEDTPTRRRHTPARESQEQREKTPKKEEKASPKGSTQTKKSDIVVREVSKNLTYDVVEPAKVVKDDQPATGQKGRRGRPKKEVKKEKDNITLKKGDGDTSGKMAEEEEATYQILDSVEDETVDDQSPTGQLESLRKESITKNDDEQTKNSASLPGSPRNEEEEEPVYQIVDSLEDDEDELTATEVCDKGGEENSNNEAKEGESTEKGETATRCTKALEGSEKIGVKEDSMYELVEDLEDVHVDPPATEESDSRNEERTTQTDIKKDSKSPTKSQSDTETPEVKNKQKPPEKSDTTSTLVNLDEVSEEEFPDDTAEEEELRKRQAATKEKQIAKEGRGTREREEREQRSWSSSRGGVSSGGRTRRSKERWRENEEKVEFDTKQLVKLDEVGADEAGEERALESQDRDVEFSEGEMQTFVTLDEFVEEEEEEEDVRAVQTLPETCPLLQEDESVDSLNPETLVTLDEAGGDEEEKPDEEQTEKTSTSAKGEHDDDTEESMNFVTVDEVGEVEGEVEEEEEEKEVVTTRTRGRAKKRTRQTPVRKSTRGKKDERDEEKEAVDVLPSLSTSSSFHKDPSTLSSDGPPEVQKKEEEVEAARQADIDAAPAGQETQPEHPEDQTLEECVEEGEEEKEGRSRADIKAVRKRKRELVGPEAKRARSRSPCVAADFKLLSFKPNNPLGQEFVVPKSGYFCNLCSVFYLNESTAKDAHCSSQRHFDNLKKHYQKLEQEPS
ncbi:uncharacterized protein [Pagrus major]|uniref:uncharacterized protein isoform X2 n=1 Tax=Pagrus major TaxID=143350 RepID=UPI003CC86A73